MGDMGGWVLGEGLDVWVPVASPANGCCGEVSDEGFGTWTALTPGKLGARTLLALEGVDGRAALIPEGVDAWGIAALRDIIVRSPESMKNSPRTATSVLAMRIVVRTWPGNTNTRLCACLAICGVESSFPTPVLLCIVDSIGNTNDRGSGARGKARSNRTVCCNSASCC